MLRTYENLLTLADTVQAARLASGQPMSLAQRALGCYHAAFRDLQAVLVGVGDALAGTAPVEGEWPLREVLLHVVRAERSFFGVIAYALERARSDQDLPLEIPDDVWDGYWVGDTFEEMRASAPLSGLLRYYAGLHERILAHFATITADELQAPSVFWESGPMTVRFRLYRFDSHLRQHTVQSEKALVAQGWLPTEARPLLRLIYGALARVEAATLGAGMMAEAPCLDLAEQLTARVTEIEGLLP